jgi:hypothetical protein
LKTEELADLAVPQDFDMLQIELANDDELDEAAKLLQEEMLRERLEEIQKRIQEETNNGD